MFISDPDIFNPRSTDQKSTRSRIRISNTARNSNSWYFTKGLQRDVVFYGWPIAPSNMSPNAGGRGGIAGFWPMSTAVHRGPINFGDLTPYLTYVLHKHILKKSPWKSYSTALLYLQYLVLRNSEVKFGTFYKTCTRVKGRNRGSEVPERSNPK